jgi:hypothetical protein
MKKDLFAYSFVFFLVVVTAVVYSQVGGHEFLNFDDNEYVTANDQVQKGFTKEGISWAFTTGHASNWHPLTWLSHMLDVELFGLDPKGHHLMNVFFHLVNTLLLFFVLRDVTNGVWESGFVAALFALHPVHVESVAWVAERKDVLSTMFWVLTMWAYLRYARNRTLGRYLLVCLTLSLGLMAKPMLVTLPFVFLLLDFWPLRRLRFWESEEKVRTGVRGRLKSKEWKRTLFHLVREKIPFLLIVAASSVITVVAQKRAGAVMPFEKLTIDVRVANALISYLRYLENLFWPSDLAVFYPHPKTGFDVPALIGAVLVLVSVTVIVLKLARRHPYLVVGWFWFLGTLVPVIGLIQVGSQSMADRYTYVPFVGLFMMIAWGVSGVLPAFRLRTTMLFVAAGISLAACSVVTWKQLTYWRNSVTLWEHSLAATPNNATAQFNLGLALDLAGRGSEGIPHYLEALSMRPRDADAHNNLGNIYHAQGKFPEAVAHYSAALEIHPNDADIHYNLGVALEAQGKVSEAVTHYTESLKLNPRHWLAHYNLGTVYASQGKMTEAVAHLSEASRLQPKNQQIRADLERAVQLQRRAQ